LLAAALKDLRTGQSFTLGQLAATQVVIVKPMAVW
jgi:hypothetical protein